MSLLTNIPDKAWKNKGKDYGRKPYIKGKIGDYREMMDAMPQKAVANALEKKYGVFEPESEFKKPYDGIPDYQGMEYSYSPPRPISFVDPGRIPDTRELGEITDVGTGDGYGGIGFSGCKIKCDPWILVGPNADLYCADCQSGWCSCRFNPAWGTVSSVKVTGPISDYKWDQEKIYYKLNAGASGIINILAITKNPNGKCRQTIAVECCACPSDIAYDAGNPETIAREADATITITGGCGPYIWAVSGTGFTFAEEITTGLTNTLSADDTACGAATITVTDACPTVATGYVRCTTGEWILKSSTGVLSGSEHCISESPSGTFNYELIQGNKKQIQATTITSYHHAPADLAGGTFFGCHTCVCICEAEHALHPCSSGLSNFIDGDHTFGSYNSCCGTPNFTCPTGDESDECASPFVNGVDNWACSVDIACTTGLTYYEWECSP